jgi:hypothetical protein
MADPVTTLTASAIATLAFQKFLETGAGELAKKFSTEAIAKMDMLLKRIWVKLRGKPRVEEVKATIDQTHKITPEQANQIAAYLQVAMDEDPKFANDIRLLAQEITAGKLVDQSHMTQNIYDQAKGWQTNVEGGTAYIGEIHIQGKSDEG